MTEKEYLKGNKLIAKFMGLNVQDCHIDWRVLMPVVEKIEEIIQGGFKISSSGCYITYSYSPKKFTHYEGGQNKWNKWKDPRTPFDTLGGRIFNIYVGYPLDSPEKKKAETKIDAVWLACVKFIEWYNKTVKK